MVTNQPVPEGPYNRIDFVTSMFKYEQISLF